MSKNNLASIVVLYYPVINELKKNLIQLQKNFSVVIVVNNSIDIDLSFLKSKKITVINNQNNLGLAKALNIGVTYAKKRGFSYFAFFDQDTSIPNNYSKCMMENINNYLIKNKSAIFCPTFFNILTSKINKINILKLFYISKTLPSLNKFSYPTYCITSGSIISDNIFNKIGKFEEDLFIDLVDTEFCMRAKYFGFKTVQINQVVINHNLGVKYLQFLNHKIQIHSPLRTYYFFRNSFYLYSLKHISFNWIFVDFYRNFFRLLFYTFFLKNRFTYIKYIINGCYHGIVKRLGKFD